MDDLFMQNIVDKKSQEANLHQESENHDLHDMKAPAE